MTSRSNVDSTLFGDNTARSRKLRMSGRRQIGSDGEPVTHPIVISRTELQRMMASTKIQTDAEIRQERELQKAAQEEKMRESKLRRERMELKEAQRKAALPKSKLQLRRIEEAKRIKAHANQLVQEREDDVKTMNAMVQYSRTVAIRDAQLREKKLIARKKILEEKREGILMEIARIKQVKKYIDRENRVRAKARKDREHIEIQIAARAEKVKQEHEAKLREQKRMADRMAAMDKMEEERRSEKRAQAKILLDDILEDNRRQIAHRKKLRQMDIEEDLRIHQYQLDLQAKQKRLEEEKEAKAKERTLKIARMRAAQKKNQDKQAALDALRAKRAAEENERRARERDLKEAREKAKAVEKLQEFRLMQKAAKKASVAAADELNRQEFYRNADQRRKELAKVKKEQELEEKKRNAHKLSLLADINERERKAKAAQQAFVKLGIAAEREKEAHLAHLNGIKAKKIQELRETGVPERYLSELDGFDPRKVLLADYKKGL